MDVLENIVIRWTRERSVHTFLIKEMFSCFDFPSKQRYKIHDKDQPSKSENVNLGCDLCTSKNKR